MAVRVRNRRGQEVTLLNPWEKGSKAFEELTNNVKLTNDFTIKFKRNGKPQTLTDTEKAYRNGYLQAQKDSRKCYKHNKAKAKCR